MVAGLEQGPNLERRYSFCLNNISIWYSRPHGRHGFSHEAQDYRPSIDNFGIDLME